MKDILPTIRPLPYFTVHSSHAEKQLAAALRKEFVPKIARGLPGHHLRGFSHDFIVSFVKKHKKQYPFFLRMDIAGFYPGIRHRDLVVGAQVAYRDLLGLDYVPSAFKKRYVGALQSWTNSLPLHRGIPLGSALSGILAPLMLLPLWLDLKKLYRVPFIVYMDDLLVLTDSAELSAEIYAFVENRLAFDFDLQPHTGKTHSGRFSQEAVDFCGWHFSGGYTRVSDEKTNRFRQRITNMCRATGKERIKEIPAFIKQINHTINGFGNYYKHGDVKNQFVSLDAFVRLQVRQWLRRRTGRHYSNAALEGLGLRGLVKIRQKQEDRWKSRSRGNAGRYTPMKGTLRAKGTSRTEAGSGEIVTHQSGKQQAVFLPAEIIEAILRIDDKLTQLVAGHRRQLRLIESLTEV